MSKRYLLVNKSKYSVDNKSFYTIEEAKAVAKTLFGENTIIDLEDKNIEWNDNNMEWQGCE